MQDAQIRRNEAYLLVRRLGRLPELTLVSARERSQAMTEDAAQRSRLSASSKSYNGKVNKEYYGILDYYIKNISSFL
jgi:hypothetical protein